MQQYLADTPKWFNALFDPRTSEVWRDLYSSNGSDEHNVSAQLADARARFRRWSQQYPFVEYTPPATPRGGGAAAAPARITAIDDQLLRGVGLSAAEAADALAKFAESDIGPDELRELSQNVLKAMGFSQLEVRIKLLKLKARQEAALAAADDGGWV